MSGSSVRWLVLAAVWNASPMPSFPPTFADQVVAQPAHAQFEAFLDEHRGALNGCLDGLTEEQARRSLVVSRTTLLGLVKHATFVEKVWFDEAVTCRSRAEIGIPATPDESFVLDDNDTIAPGRIARRLPNMPRARVRSLTSCRAPRAACLRLPDRVQRCSH
jgi:hypothetical protein